MALTLYELGGRDDRRYSLYSWRARYALAHKGLAVEYKPVRISDKGAIAFSKQEKVPILVDGDPRHLRGVMEKAFGKSLEELATNREKDVVALRRLLDPARAQLRAQPFISGSKPAYADYILLSPLQW